MEVPFAAHPQSDRRRYRICPLHRAPGKTKGQQMGHHFAQMGHKMGHHSAPMGYHFVQMGHEMGHHSAPMGHHFVQMGHKRTPTDTKMASCAVMVKHGASRGVSRRFSGAEWPKNQVRMAKADSEPFCDFRRLWYTPSCKFSVLQGWRHGVRSRSLGGILFYIAHFILQIRSGPEGCFFLYRNQCSS
jgi:hypothetical protein